MSSSTSSSSSERLGKAPFAVGFALLLVVLSAAPLAWRYGEHVAKTHPDFTRSKRMQKFLEPRREGVPLVLTLGDSTLRSPIPFPIQVGAWIKDPVEMRTLWVLGLSQGEAILVAARALELEPAALVLVAHFAMFESEQPLRLRELQRLVPLRRLPDLLGLPFSIRGVGLGELVFSSLVGALVPSSWVEAKRGGARWFEFSLRQRWRVNPGTEAHQQERFDELKRASIARSTRPFHAGHPSFEMVRGTVRMAERRGVEVLVVVSPVNVAAVEEAVGFDGERFREVVGVLRETVESEGGDLIDMHDRLEPEQFIDDLGHYYASGAYRIAIPVEAWTRGVLGLPPSERHGRPGNGAGAGGDRAGESGS